MNTPDSYMITGIFWLRVVDQLEISDMRFVNSVCTGPSAVSESCSIC